MHTIQRTAPSTFFLLLFMAFLAVPNPITADSTIIFTTGNDDFSGNSDSDDLYSSGLGLALQFNGINKGGSHKGGLIKPLVLFQENMFTDKEHGLRFDETWLLAGGRLERNLWGLSLLAGAVRTGEGFIGERGQNAIHRLIGDDEVQFDYVNSTEFFPVIEVRLNRLLLGGRRVTVEASGEFRYAQGFQQHAILQANGILNINNWLVAFVGLGARASWAQYDPLEPWIKGVSPTLRFGLDVCDQVQITWSSNNFGTERNQITLNLTLFKKRGRSTRGV